MKKNRVLRIVLLLDILCVLFFSAVLVYGVWTMNMPFDWKVPFPEGTQIIQKSDTHQGVFRRHGVAVVVAKIPESHIQAYGDKLRRVDFSAGHPIGMAPELLSDIEAAREILDSENTLYTYQDEAVALIEEPFSDWFTAIYDLETGLFCFMEYDE